MHHQFHRGNEAVFAHQSGNVEERIAEVVLIDHRIIAPDLQRVETVFPRESQFFPEGAPVMREQPGIITV